MNSKLELDIGLGHELELDNSNLNSDSNSGTRTRQLEPVLYFVLQRALELELASQAWLSFRCTHLRYESEGTGTASPVQARASRVPVPPLPYRSGRPDLYGNDGKVTIVLVQVMTRPHLYGNDAVPSSMCRSGRGAHASTIHVSRK